MRDDRRNYIVVGVFVLGLVAALIAWITALSGFLGRTDPYFIVYKNVTGLSPGTEVLFEGYRVGMIEDVRNIERDGQPLFRVDVSVREGWRIPEDSSASIAAPSFLAAVAIDIRTGSSAQALAPGGEIEAQEIVNVVSKLSEVADGVNAFVEQIRPTVDTFGAKAPELIENVHTFTVEMNDAVGRVNELLGPETRERLHRILENVDDASGAAAQFASELQNTRRQVDATLARVDAIIARSEPNVDESLADLHASLEAVSRRIDAITFNLEATTRNMNEFSREIRSNPGLIIRGRESGEPPEGADR